MTEEKKQDNSLIVNITLDIKNAIDAEFKSRFTQTTRNKIYFIVDRINKKRSEEINSRNYYSLLGLSSSADLKFIMDGLVRLSIIKKTADYIINVRCNTFEMVTPFNINNSEKIFFHPDIMVIPKWVEKYIAAGYSIPNVNTTNKRKVIGKPEANHGKIQQEQAKRILELELELADLKALLTTSNHQTIIEINNLEMDEIDLIDEPSVEYSNDEDVKIFPKSQQYPAMTINNYSLIRHYNDDEIKEEIYDANLGKGELYGLGLTLDKYEDYNNGSITATLSR